MATPTPADMQSVKKVVLVNDLAGHTRISRDNDDMTVALFLHEYYTICDRHVTEAGGTIVKFMGDSCLSTFPEAEAAKAVAAAVAIGREVDELARSHGLDTMTGANVHLARFVEGEIGTGPSRHFDVLGRGVDQAFLLGRGPGIRISEAVYRKLASADRTPWRKHKPPAVYRFEGTGGVLEYGGKTEQQNTAQ